MITEYALLRALQAMLERRLAFLERRMLGDSVTTRREAVSTSTSLASKLQKLQQSFSACEKPEMKDFYRKYFGAIGKYVHQNKEAATVSPFVVDAKVKEEMVAIRPMRLKA